jgi:hypothetical protein
MQEKDVCSAKHDLSVFSKPSNMTMLINEWINSFITKDINI